MVKKKVKKKVKVSGGPWFRKRAGAIRSQWGFIPINWKGRIALILLIGINVFAANYFNITNVPFKEVSKFLVVFFFSITVFILIARRKTASVKDKK